ncbi:MAG: ATP-binding cassette domain-containing protein [Syntrophomonadaceae bacterium]|jgi:putative ABC transport system ATP-binding protein|nr:ATP-binding cassette domain-containing protein [Syntrophomonadaceae bacterium]
MLRINNLSKTFNKGTQNEKKVLKQINLTLAEGEFAVIIGGNGAGKSTLLNCIAGVHSIDSGRIIIGNHDITNWPEYRRSLLIGRVFQDPLMGTAFAMTIEENLAMALAKGKSRGLQPGIRRSDKRVFRDRLAQLGLGLENRMSDKVGLLSGGQRQALTLLMATIVRPSLLMLDEHTAALDPLTSQKVLQLTRDMVAAENLTTLMVTHNMADALAFGTRTLMMHEGNIILDLQGEQRSGMTVETLIASFKQHSGQELINDRLLLS